MLTMFDNIRNVATMNKTAATAPHAETTENAEDGSTLITITDTAEMLGLTLVALQLRLQRGTFPVTPFRFTPRGKRYFRRSDIARMIDAVEE